MDLRRFLAVLRSWAWLLILGTLVGGALAYYLTSRLPATYAARATLIVGQSLSQSDPAYDQLLISQRLSQTYARVATTRPVLERVAESLSQPLTADALAARARVNAEAENALISIVVEDTDPVRAADMASGLAVELVAMAAAVQAPGGDNEAFATAELEATRRSLTKAHAELERLQEAYAATLAERQDLAGSLAADPNVMLEPDREVTAQDIVLISAEIEELADDGSLDDGEQARLEALRASHARLVRLDRVEDRALSEETRIERLESRTTSLRASHATLLSLAGDSEPGRLSILEPAVPPTMPAGPSLALATVLGMLIGSLLALAVALALTYLDDRLRTAEEIEAIVGAPTLGRLPRMPRRARGPQQALQVLDEPRSPLAEAVRAMRTNIEFAGVDRPLQVIVVTSAIPAEGKTTVAANLAASFAQEGQRTLLIDADLRRPAIHDLLGLPNDQGLSQLIRSGVALSAASVMLGSGHEYLRVLPSGPPPPDPAELLGSRRFRALLDQVRGDFDRIIIDGPALAPVTDAALMAALADGTLIVIDSGRSRRDLVRRAREALTRVNAPVAGAVLNRLAPGDGEYPSKHFGDYYRRADRRPAQRAGAVAVAGVPMRSKTEPAA